MIREYRRAVVRTIELEEKGTSPPAIAASAGIPEELVRSILEKAEKIREEEDARVSEK